MSENKTVIILANFGTTVCKALKGILTIKEAVKERFPEIDIKITFTSNIIREVWKKRKLEKEKWIKQGVPEEIIEVKGIISTVGDAIEEGAKNIVVQPTHIFYMEQVHDLHSYIKAFQSIKTMQKRWMPFNKIVMARPALGMFSEEYDYRKDIEKAIKILKKDVEKAIKEDSTLLYMAHGNERFPMGIFYEVEAMFNQIYPEVNTVFACVEGYPSFSEALKKIRKKKVILKPFMIVAGVHAREDMKNWENRLKDLGFDAVAIFEGLGENREFAEIFADHTQDAMKLI